MFHLARVKRSRHVPVAAGGHMAFTSEVESSAVVGTKAKDFKDSGGGGAGGGKPAIEGVILAGRGDAGPEGPKEGVKLGVGHGLHGTGWLVGWCPVTVGAAALRGNAGSRCSAPAPACAILVARGGCSPVGGTRGGLGWRDGALAEVGGEVDLVNGVGWGEAFVYKAFCGRVLIGSREVPKQEFLCGDDVAELAVCLAPEVVNYFAWLFAEPFGVHFQRAALFKKSPVEVFGKAADEAVGEEEGGAAPDSSDIGNQL